MTDEYVPPAARPRFDDAPREERYTLEEARRRLAKDECLMHGHDTDQLVDPSSGEIVGLLCSRCARSWKVTPVREGADEQLAADLEELLTAARERLPIGRLRKALHVGLGPINVGVTGEPPREAELEERCRCPLYRPAPPPKPEQQGPPFAARGFPPPREVEAICFLEPGHHGSHRSEAGHIWSGQ